MDYEELYKQFETLKTEEKCDNGNKTGNINEIQLETIRKNSYLSKYGYVINKRDLSSDEIIYIKTELRAKPLQDEKYAFDGNDPSFPVYIETKNKFYLPKFWGINRYGKPYKENSNYIGKEWAKGIEFAGELYPKQIEPAEKMIKSCKEDGGGILQLSTGFGKTICTLYILSKLHGKTLIIVNKIPLMKQWINEINRFLPNARVGVIQGQKNVDINDKDIIVAMLQSLARIDYPDEIFHDIRITVTDECHNTASRMFSKVFTKLCSKFSIGLSATPKRGDGCEYVFKWHIGEIIFRSHEKREGKHPIVRMIKLNSDDYKEISSINRITGKTQVQFTSMLSELIEMESRNRLIIKLLEQLTNEGRKILVLSDRRAHLTTIRDLLQKNSDNYKFTWGLFLGSMKQRDLDKSRQCDIILATYQSFSEGVSERDLDTLLLITPKKYVGHLQNATKADNGKIEQIVGRIFRKEHTERNPLIIDLHDNFSVYKTQGNSRKVFYKQHFKKMIFEEQKVDLNDSDLQIINVKKTDWGGTMIQQDDENDDENHDDNNEQNNKNTISNYCMLD